MSDEKFYWATRFFVKAFAFFIISSLPLTSMAAQQFSILVTGQAQPIITNSSGSSLGVVPDTGVLVQELLNANLNLGSDSSFMSIDDPAPGDYVVTLHGSYEENITITLLFVDSVLAINEEITLLTLFHGAPISFSFTIDGQAQQALVVSPPIDTVTNLSFEDNSGVGRLTWSASVDPNIASYKVYGKSPQDAFFAPIADVTALLYDTGHPVRTDDTGVQWDYIVTGIASDGSEGFYDTVLDNRLRIRAFFSANQRTGIAPFSVQFTDESLGNPTSWQWDFNGDNVVDSTEQNPEYTFNSIGKYSISLTISGLLGIDDNTQNSYITVIADTDGDGLSDSSDNCILSPNPLQRDTDGDGYGNYCDADLNNDLTVNLSDFSLFRGAFGTTDPNADFNGDGSVNLSDFSIFRSMFGSAPGPSCCAP